MSKKGRLQLPTGQMTRDNRQESLEGSELFRARYRIFVLHGSGCRCRHSDELGAEGGLDVELADHRATWRFGVHGPYS